MDTPTYCSQCGKKMVDSFCHECKKKTLVANSNFEQGFDIPQIPISFNAKDPSFGSYIFKSNHIMHSINLDSNTPFGNLQLIFINILQDIEYLNGRITACFKSYAVGMYYGLSAKITDHQRMVEEVIYWMRRIVDRLISIHWFLFEFNKSGNYPIKIKVDSVGRLLKLSDNDPFRNEYTENGQTFLNFLNEASNAYKHLLVNGESPSLRIGKEEPLVITLGLANNNISSEQKYNHKSLSEVVVMFISFYKEAREKLEKYKKSSHS